ncbi:reverse transcriptase family protein, partial [Pseudoalteromonas sp.]|uniref:RNA-directed DNA polymerase n=1 Tax=Pseudoalteromonas sp. TaxID=53249 RepID=UPI00260F8741
LRAQAAHLAAPISALINRCIADGQYPSIWKRARIAAIPMIIGSANPFDYRPVSVLPLLSKIFEHWLLLLLEPFLKTHFSQFGFKKGSSTEDAIGHLQHLVAQGLQSCPRSGKVIIASLDVTRAFDQVPHQSLLTVLQQRGVPFILLRLLKSYLAGREYFIRIGQASSDMVPVLSGVPQGGILAPFLFNVYVDSICSQDFSTGTSVILYADDLLLIIAIPDLAAELSFHEDLNLIYQAYQNLFLTLNGAKSKFLICSISPRPATISQVPSINGVPLVQVSELKYLGVVFDRRLAFDVHNQLVSLRAKRCIGVLFSSVGKWAGPIVFSRLYKSKILPILMYSIPLAAPRFSKDWTGLEKVHRFALRLIANDYTSSYRQLLIRLHFKPVVQMYYERGLLLMYKYIHGFRRLTYLLSVTLSNLRHRLRNRNSHSFCVIVPNFKSVACDVMPVYRLFKLWNGMCLDGFTIDRYITADMPIFRRFCRRHDLFLSAAMSNSDFLPSFSRL